MSVWDKTELKNESISISDFQWSEEAPESRCPKGRALRSEWRAFQNQRSHVTKADTIIFRSRQTVCSRHERKNVEMLFAYLKRILKLDRLRLRGVTGANDEFTLAAAVQNLR